MLYYKGGSLIVILISLVTRPMHFFEDLSSNHQLQSFLVLIGSHTRHHKHRTNIISNLSELKSQQPKFFHLFFSTKKSILLFLQ